MKHQLKIAWNDFTKIPIYQQQIVITDGGKTEAGIKGKNDCVIRAIAIATGKPYREVYDELRERIIKFSKGSSWAAQRAGAGLSSPDRTFRNGINKKVYVSYLKELGFRWVPTMEIGSGCRVHLRGDELPSGVIIAKITKHLVTVIDGVIYDIVDCSRKGTRCVYGYFIKD